MKTKLNEVALGLGGALFAGVALAGGGVYPVDPVQEPARTRAEVQAELRTAAPLIRGDVYPVAEPAARERMRNATTRADVRAELESAPALIRGDVYPVLDATTRPRASADVRAAESRARHTLPGA